MIDYVKILFLNIDTRFLFSNQLLTFYRKISEKTGLYENKRVAKYHYCKIIIYDSGIVMFQGSIHKLYNSIKSILAPNYDKKYIQTYKGFNGNLFTLNNIYEVKTHLEILFNCNAEQMQFQSIEFGVNTTPGFNPNLFTKGLLFHKNKCFEYRYNNNLAQAIHQRYIFKIYNKSYQYGIKEHTLRVELKVMKMEEIKELGIKTFADVNYLTMKKAKDMLLSRFNEVVYYDYTINNKLLANSEKRLLKEYSNPRYWIEDLKPNHRDRPKKKLANLIIKYSDNLHQQIKEDISQKCVIINQELNKPKRVINNRSSTGLNITYSTINKCLITGITLERENGQPNYIRTATLRHLKKSDYNTYALLCSILLVKSKKRPKYESDEIEHICKQIRNRFYNIRKIKQQGYNRKQYQNQLKLQL